MEGEEDYTIEKLWGLGPLKKEPLVENPQDVVNLERYKVIIGIIQQGLLNGCGKDCYNYSMNPIWCNQYIA